MDSMRHLVAHARNHLGKRRPRYHATRRQREELAQSLVAAAHKGDLPALEALLTQEAALHSDGGGTVPALGRPVGGRERVAQTALRGFSVYAHHGVRIRLTVVNGQPGALAYDAQDRLVGVMGLDIAEGRIQTIHPINNPRQAAPPAPGQRPRHPDAPGPPIRRQRLNGPLPGKDRFP
ncbi:MULTISPECIES: hypothetical protein [unclassified Streptomyces]|uniref:hypothetical protein n=1 Tax=unclassified Streptomyces TaxID=2593676 RepID=UPI003369F526